MKLHPTRGAKFGGWSAVFFAIVAPINNLLKQDPVNWGTIAIGAVFVFIVFGMIGTVTDKLGSEMGDA